MQTFLPYPSVYLTSRILDYRRLGKQRVEAYQILNTLTGVSNGWKNHPAVKMWRGYENALRVYGWGICEEWIHRGYKDTLLEKFNIDNIGNVVWPKWFGDWDFHYSHQSNLLRKDPIYYSKYNWSVPNNLPYVWPI